MRLALLCCALIFCTEISVAQTVKRVEKIQQDSTRATLNEVVVTGEYQQQSLKNSVYRTRIIDSERIRLRAATNIQQVLNTELGFRFSNDMTLGTSDVQLMGMSGRNVKILLDGVPMIDRNDSRESLNQIDINTIERIEIVEGPLSVSYGSDALAGVINIITKGPGKENWNLNARVQEETAGSEYKPFGDQGVHLQHLGGGWQQNRWSVMAGLSHQDFTGFNLAPATATAEEVASVINRWKPKEQWLANTRIGYRSAKANVWYRADYVNEVIDSKGALNPNTYKSINQKYVTDRWTHQVQGDFRLQDNLNLNGMVAYSNLKRATQTSIHDFTDGSDVTSTGQAEQDVSKFNTVTARTTLVYKLSPGLSFQPGLEFNRDAADGARIKGSPVINDYSLFLSSEWKAIDWLMLRPGLRFTKNSVYDAPPVIPSLNVKIKLNPLYDFRIGYASGFRAPALRELYYDFIDASHTIIGNENLKAEQSNSFNASLTRSNDDNAAVRTRIVLTGFYNYFRNRIDYGLSAEDPTVTTLINIDRFKTTGGTMEGTAIWKDFQASLGFSMIGTYNKYAADADAYGESPQFVWSPEVNTNLTYTFPKWDATVNFSGKFTGARRIYVLATAGAVEQAQLTKTGSFTLADLMFTKKIFNGLNLNAGVKNLFDVTSLSNTGTDTGAAHSTGAGPVPYQYGRSYVVGLNFNISK